MAEGIAPRGDPTRLRVVLVDDESLIRAGLAMLLDAEPDIAVVGQAFDGESALEEVAQSAPDVVIMDIRMPGMGGVEATRQLTSDSFADRHNTTPAVLILTTFILKNSAPRALADAIRALARAMGGSTLQ